MSPSPYTPSDSGSSILLAPRLFLRTELLAGNGSTPASPGTRPIPSALADPALGLLLVGTIGTAVLVPIAVTFCFSAARLRLHLLFPLCLLVIALGVAAGAINIYVQTQALQGNPFASASDSLLVSLAFVIPVIVQAALLLKIAFVYRWAALSWLRRALVYVPSVLLKVARVVFITLTISDVWQYNGSTSASASPWRGAWRNSYAKAGWVIQLADDSYASALLIARVWCVYKAGVNGHSFSEPPRQKPELFLKTVASCFVLPAALDVVQLCLGFLYTPDANHIPNAGSYTALCIVLAGVYVQITSLLFTAMWYPAASRHPAPSAGTASIALDEHPAGAGRFLSPLPEHPSMSLFPSDYGTGSSHGWERDSETLRVDGDSAVDVSVEKLKIKVWPHEQPHRDARGNWAFEPSTLSFEGSVREDGLREPVFYAM